MSLSRCRSCQGVVPAAAAVCPHCEVSLPAASVSTRLGKLALGLLGGMGASMTLMACYGAPPCDFVSTTLPDGGLGPSRCGFEPVNRPDTFTDGGVSNDAGADGGVTIDGGSSDAGQSDAGP